MDTKEVIRWANTRVAEIFDSCNEDDIIERIDLQGALLQYERSRGKKGKYNSIWRIKFWKNNRVQQLKMIKENGLAKTYLSLGGK